MDQKTKEIQMSVAYNNACRLLSRLVNTGGEYEEIAIGIDKMARVLYAKQIKFLEEIKREEEILRKKIDNEPIEEATETIKKLEE